VQENAITKTLICDVETDALVGYQNLWCIVTYCLETGEEKVFDCADPGYLEAFKDYSKDATHWVGHNFGEFDRYVILGFTGTFIPITQITDTLILSRLFNSGRDGGHSLERWGAYFHLSKFAYDEWKVYDKRIVERCRRDVAITTMLYAHLRKEGARVSEFAKKLEHGFVDFLCDMKRRGFPVDIEGIEKELAISKAKLADIDARVKAVFPPRAKALTEVVPKYKQDGEMSVVGIKRVGGNPLSLVQGPFTLIKWEPFNIGSPKQVVERMNEYGWQPVEFTKGGEDKSNPQPKVSPANLETLPADAPEEAKLIVEFNKLDTRIGLMENWIDNYSPSTGKIHGSIIHIGTITQRCSHNNPNTGNIPNTHGGEIREYWGYPKDSTRRLVGVDAKGIQLRILAHLTAGFTNDPIFMDAVLRGDPHIDFTLPRVAAIAPHLVAYTTPEELHHVKQAKTKRFIYAYLLGAGDLKTGVIFGGSREEGKAIREGFTHSFPGLPELRQYLGECARKGWYPLPSGAFAPIKSEHYALSVALQGIESVIMKLAGILFRKKARHLDAHPITFVHDEYQLDCLAEHADEAGKIMAMCIHEAGEILKLRCPMDGDYRVGFNWLETH
jgi:DNA polymerase-1